MEVLTEPERRLAIQVSMSTSDDGVRLGNTYALPLTSHHRLLAVEILSLSLVAEERPRASGSSIAWGNLLVTPDTENTEKPRYPKEDRRNPPRSR